MPADEGPEILCTSDGEIALDSPEFKDGLDTCVSEMTGSETMLELPERTDETDVVSLPPVFPLAAVGLLSGFDIEIRTVEKTDSGGPERVLTEPATTVVDPGRLVVPDK